MQKCNLFARLIGYLEKNYFDIYHGTGISLFDMREISEFEIFNIVVLKVM